MKKSYLLTLFFILFTSFSPVFLHTAHASFSDNPLTVGTISGLTVDLSATPLNSSLACPSAGSGASIYGKVYNNTYPDTSSVASSNFTGTCFSSYSRTWNDESGNEFMTPYVLFPSTPADGSYWAYFYSADDASYYWNFTVSSGVISSGGLPNAITSQLTPISGSTVGYNVNFTGTYNQSATYDHICANFTTTDASVAPYCSSIPAINGTGLTYNFNYVLTPNHTYGYSLQLWDSVNNLFTTATSPIAFATSALSTTATPAYTPETCDWTSPPTYTGCIDNIFYALLYPSSSSITQFNGLYAEFINKPPFGYISAIITSLQGLNDTGTSAFSLQSLPILNTYIFTPIRTALGWILWFGFAFLLIKLLPSLQL